MNEYLKVKDTPYVRDINSKAILNTDKKGLNEYQLKRTLAEKQNQETQELKNKMLNIETEMQEIKQLLLRIINNDN